MDLLQKSKESEGDTGGKFGEYRVEHLSYSETPKIIQWVIKYSGGLVKDEKQAGYVLLGFAAVAIIISLFLIFGGVGKQNTPPVEQYINKQQFLPN